MDIANINLNEFINLEYFYRNIVLNDMSSKNFILMIINILKNIENLNISQVMSDKSFITINECGDIIFNINEVNFSSFNINELLNDLSKLISINKIDHNIILNFDNCKFNETVVQCINNNETVNKENKAIIKKDKVQINFEHVNFYKASLEKYNLNDFRRMYYINKKNGYVFRECSFNDDVVKYIFDIVQDDTLDQEMSTILKNAKERYIDLRSNYVYIASDQLRIGTKISKNLAKQIIANSNNENCLYSLSLEGEHISELDLTNINLTNVNMNGVRLSCKQIEQIIDGKLKGRAKGDLRGLDLSYTDLSKCNLNNVDLTGANLDGAILNMDQVKLIIDGKLKGRVKGDLHGLNLHDLRFCHTKGIDNLDNVNFTNANLDFVYFTGMCINNTVFKNTSLKNTVFSHTNICKSNLTNTSLDNTRIVNTCFCDCDFTNADMRCGLFQYVQFVGNNIFDGTNLKDANLSYNNDIKNVKFTSDNIIDIFLNNNKNLNELNLTNMNQECCQKLIEISNKKNVNFSFKRSKPSIELVKNMFNGKIPGRKKYDLSDLDFSSDLYFVQNEMKLNEIFNSYVKSFFSFIWSKDDFIDLTDSNLQGLNLNGLSSKKVKLNYANLTNSNLIDCDLTQAELFNVNLNGAILYGTKFTLEQFKHLVDCDNFKEQSNLEFIKNLNVSEKEKINFAKYFINKRINLFKERCKSTKIVYNAIEDKIFKDDSKRSTITICDTIENGIKELNDIDSLENVLLEFDDIVKTKSAGVQIFKK